jgi:hypothetical protein
MMRKKSVTTYPPKSFSGKFWESKTILLACKNLIFAIQFHSMSRATHDAGCQNCGFQGKVNDEAITCPECGQSIEGVALTGDVLEAMLERINLRAKEFSSSSKKEIKD